MPQTATTDKKLSATRRPPKRERRVDKTLTLSLPLYHDLIPEQSPDFWLHDLLEMRQAAFIKRERQLKHSIKFPGFMGTPNKTHTTNHLLLQLDR